MRKGMHPNLILGLVSFVIFLLGVVLNFSNNNLGMIMIIGSVVLGFIHWVWSIIDAFRNYKINAAENRIIWLILIIVVPPIGGILFYMMSPTVRM